MGHEHNFQVRAGDQTGQNSGRARRKQIVELLRHPGLVESPVPAQSGDGSGFPAGSPVAGLRKEQQRAPGPRGRQHDEAGTAASPFPCDWILVPITIWYWRFLTVS
jgi:hypothetical protein